ncbi:DUF6221 family protein [Streptomyces radiopugnans]|nr:DUF6221 family protein [Streptomyces radiopugnans]
MELIEFLTARLDEDEQVARATVWDGSGNQPDWSLPASATVDVGGDEFYAGDRTIADHIDRHDPARVLREVEAKRRIVEEHGIVHRDIGWLKDGGEEYDETPVCGTCVPKNSHFQRREDVPEGPCGTVRALAAVYAEHPDFDPAWLED